MSETKSKATVTIGQVSEDYIAGMRLVMRLNPSILDTELINLVNAARADLVQGGVRKDKAEDESDPLIWKAVTTYIKAEFGLDNEDSEKYSASFKKQKTALALADDYIGPKEG
ncbi:MAG: DNA-packaging protein [Acutalibacter sp.]|nr:DNA-packaging protein [Acutalibacter sp.]